MLEILLSMSKDRPGLFIALIGMFFMALLWVFFISYYIYKNIYIKKSVKLYTRMRKDLKD